MNPISPVIQQKTLFMFINSLLPRQISKLNHASHDACPAQWRWQWCAAQVERRGKRGEREQPIQQECTLYINFVVMWNCTQIQCMCEALLSVRTGGFTDSVLVILVWDSFLPGMETLGLLQCEQRCVHRCHCPSEITWVCLAAPQELSKLESWVISSWTVYNRCIRWNCAIWLAHQYHLF